MNKKSFIQVELTKYVGNTCWNQISYYDQIQLSESKTLIHSSKLHSVLSVLHPMHSFNAAVVEASSRWSIGLSHKDFCPSCSVAQLDFLPDMQLFSGLKALDGCLEMPIISKEKRIVPFGMHAPHTV